MCHPACITFVEQHISPEEIEGRQIIEVGSYDVNGSVRPLIERYAPANYIGVDIIAGPSVDIVQDAHYLLDRFEPEAFDVAISTEMVEHIRNWQVVYHNLKTLLKPGGLLIITTRSYGFPYHGFPHDFWRYEAKDMMAICEDMLISDIKADPLDIGIFLAARKPHEFKENDLSDYPLYSIILDKRVPRIYEHEIVLFRVKYQLFQIRNYLFKVAGYPYRRLKSLVKASAQ